MSTEESHEDHGHHLPAVEDWPRGFGEATWWPFLAAIGATGLYVGVALFLLGRGPNAIVAPIVGPAVIIAGVVLFLSGLYLWMYHAFIKAFWSHESPTGGSKLKWGMLLFLASDFGTFGAGFGYYFFVRAGSWTANIPDVMSSLVLVNTAVLVASSFTLHWAHVSLHRENRRQFLLGMIVTIVLGICFVGGQAIEYYGFIVREGFTISSGIFASAFFGLTGLHGAHVIFGTILLLIVFLRGAFGQYSSTRDVSISTVSMYWHFVDAVWIFLVVVIYVGSTVGS